MIFNFQSLVSISEYAELDTSDQPDSIFGWLYFAQKMHSFTVYNNK